MGAVVHESILALAAELGKEFTQILERHLESDTSGVLEHYSPFGLRLYTIDGYTARFLEEGVEFYPEVKD